MRRLGGAFGALSAFDPAGLCIHAVSSANAHCSRRGLGQQPLLDRAVFALSGCRSGQEQQQGRW
ncbi:MAG: hypothetical protein ACK47B_27615 [Armatimonadota bacterium]